MTSPSRRLVERFYDDVWNKADEVAAAEILALEFRFRASLGPERIGPAAFIDYMRSIHAALRGYTCSIIDLIESGDRVAARMDFRGVHQGVFFGVPATGREIAWSGGAFFTTNGLQIVESWVLGDIDAVKQQLGAGPETSFS